MKLIFEDKRDFVKNISNNDVISYVLLYSIVIVIKSRRLRWADHVAKMKEGWSYFKILTGNPSGNRTLRRPRRKWEKNIRI